MKKLKVAATIVGIAGIVLALCTAGSSDQATIPESQLAVQYIISLVCILVLAIRVRNEF